MVVLRGQTENGNCSPNILVVLVFIGVANKLRNRELSTLDPELCGLVNGLKCHHTAICTADQGAGIVGVRDGPCIFLQLSVEKFVESFCNRGVRQ